MKTPTKFTKEQIEAFKFLKIKIINEPIKSLYPIGLATLSDNGFVIGGSIALRLHGYLIDREINEIDLIVDGEKNDIDILINSTFPNYKFHEWQSSEPIDSIGHYVGYFGEKYDIIKQKDIKFDVIIYCGYVIKVQNISDIWNAKLRYALLGSEKHIDDLKNNKIKFEFKKQ